MEPEEAVSKFQKLFEDFQSNKRTAKEIPDLQGISARQVPGRARWPRRSHGLMDAYAAVRIHACTQRRYFDIALARHTRLALVGSAHGMSFERDSAGVTDYTKVHDPLGPEWGGWASVKGYMQTLFSPNRCKRVRAVVGANACSADVDLAVANFDHFEATAEALVRLPLFFQST